MKAPGRRPATSSRRLAKLASLLLKHMPTAHMELTHRSAWELLVATILSAQCTDQRVNQVTPGLFKRFHTPQDYAAAPAAELEQLIRPTGFYKSKAKHLIGCGRAVSERFGGKVPDRMEDLTTIPGVGRKTANVLLGNVFGQPVIVVDTHVKRVANRLALTMSDNPDVIEQDLQRQFPSAQWTDVSQRLLLHGRYVCLARNPRCASCFLYEDCTWKGKLPR